MTHPIDISFISNKDDSVRVEKLLNIDILNISDVVSFEVEFPEVFSSGSQARIILNSDLEYVIKELEIANKRMAKKHYLKALKSKRRRRYRN